MMRHTYLLLALVLGVPASAREPVGKWAPEAKSGTGELNIEAK